jgi:transposase
MASMATDTGSLLDVLNQKDLNIGDRITVSLEFAETEGYLHPTDSLNKPEWLQDEDILPLFQTYLERFQKSGANSYKSSSQDGGYKFSFEVKEQLATLTILKEDEAPDIAPKRGGDGRRKYNDDAREQILEAIKNGMTAKDAAEKYEVSTATINLWKKAAGLSSGKRGRKPGSKNTSTRSAAMAHVTDENTLQAVEAAVKVARSGAKSRPDTITLNGITYVAADRMPSKSESKAESKNRNQILKAIAKLESEMATLRDILEAQL